DIDIFQDREERVAQAAEADAASLAEQGFVIRWLRRAGGVQTLLAQRAGEDVRLEWVTDSDFASFPPCLTRCSVTCCIRSISRSTRCRPRQTGVNCATSSILSQFMRPSCPSAYWCGR